MDGWEDRPPRKKSHAAWFLGSQIDFVSKFQTHRSFKIEVLPSAKVLALEPFCTRPCESFLIGPCKIVLSHTSACAQVTVHSSS